MNDAGTGDSWIDVRSDLSIAGAGEILLNGDNQNDYIAAYFGHTLTQGADHTIRGFGAIHAPVVNHGTVDADRAGGFLRLTGSPKTSDGLLRASNGGELQIHNCPIQNAEGTIFVDGGDVQLYNHASVSGGTIRCSGFSVVKAQNGWISDAVIAEDGWVDVPRDYSLYLSGSQIVNNGTIRLNASATGNAWIDVRNHVLLSGAGRILLNGDNFDDYIYSYFGHVLTQAQDHTIHGKGRIVCPFVNRGTVRADSASVPLRVETGSFNNQGTCEVVNGAQLQVQQTPQNYASRTLSGGTWIARANSSILLNNAPVDTANAAILLDGPGSMIYRDHAAADGLSGLAKIGPNGDFTIQNGRDFSTAGNLDVSGKLNVGDGCTFTIPGHCTSRWGRLFVEGTLASPNPIAIDRGRIYGAGTVAGDVVNESGWIFPGASIDTLTIDGNFTQDIEGRTVIELGGTSPDRIDLLRITGHADLGGTLELVAADGHHVQAGDTYKVVTYGSRQGEFDVIFGRCLEPGICLEVIYNANDVTLLAYQLDAADVIEEEGGADLPTTLRLYASSRSGSTGRLHLDLPWTSHVEINVYDVAGRIVARLGDGDHPAGSHSYQWGGGRDAGIGSGIYFARAVVRRDGETAVRTTRLLVVR